MVFIDGNNLYHRLRECNWPTWIDVGELARRVAGSARKVVGIRYYNAPPPGGRPFTERQNEYYALVKQTPGLVFKLSTLQPTTRFGAQGKYASFQEKGGDTALTTDLLTQAAIDAYDVAIVVSSDGDFAEPIDAIGTTYGKRAELIYCQGRKPLRIQRLAVMREFRRSFVVVYGKA